MAQRQGQSRGFAAISEEEHREISRRGGQASHDGGNRLKEDEEAGEGEEAGLEEARETLQEAREEAGKGKMTRKEEKEIEEEGGERAEYLETAFYLEAAALHYRQAARLFQDDKRGGRRHAKLAQQLVENALEHFQEAGGSNSIAAGQGSEALDESTNSHEFDTEMAREARRTTPQRGGGRQADSEQAPEPGRKGGQTSSGGKAGGDQNGGQRMGRQRGGSSEPHAGAGKLSNRNS